MKSNGKPRSIKASEKLRNALMNLKYKLKMSSIEEVIWHLKKEAGAK